MKKTKLLNYAPRLILIILLFISVIFLMNTVQNLLNSDVKINLTEIVTQNKDVITSKLNMEVNDLDSTATQIANILSSGNTIDNDSIYKAFLASIANNEDNNMFVAGTDGTAYFRDGNTLDISGRQYYKLAMQNLHNISDRLVSRHDGEEIFVISVALKCNGEIIGTVQKFFTPEEMYDICSISLFSEEGYMYIINKEGYILVSSRQETYSQENENYLRMIYAQGNENESIQLQNDIQNQQSGFMETTVDGKKIFSAYTPIEDIHDWYLISSVSTEAVSPNANIVIKMFYLILSVVVIIFGLSLFFFLSYKNKQKSHLEQIAFVDSVTQGNTFTKFTVDLKDALREHIDKQLYLLKFDIDNFKYVNNFYGFDVGDRMLFQINKTIESKLLPGERIARISGDHFVILLEDVSEQRLENLLDLPENEEEITIYITAGIYAITDRNESINLMVDKASTAAQTAKGSLDKKVIYYSENFDQQMIRNEQMKRSIKQAFSNHEMIPFFQPKVDILTGRLVGAEALARWLKDGNLIPPFEFIPLCEKTGLIMELDMAIFEQTLHFIKKHLDQGIHCVPISVNFSRLHLVDSHFLEKIVNKIHEYGIPANLIEVELTESAIFDNYEVISRFIDQLHTEGFLISMDDFGSGYSSLNMLKDISIDTLKIDKDFLNKTTNSERQRIIFSAVAQMANQLKINVVVEGVETLENVSLMKEVGCFVAQGYYYSKPVDESTFDKMYREGFLC